MIQKVKIKDLSTPELIPIRNGFGEGFLEVGKKNVEVVGLTADLSGSVRMNHFAEKYPDRFYEAGVSEQNMTGVAAGLALCGKIPYIGTFASFSPARNFDQIRISICMMDLNVKIVSSHAGFSHGSDGITVQMLEDIALMRSLPNMKVVVPADAVQAMQAAKQISKVSGPVYLRIGRTETPVLFDKETPFNFGKAQLLREGTDLTIIATGYLVFRALLAADHLKDQGIEAEVINIHTIKPLDEDSILESVAKTGAVVTAEEAQLFGGLGGAVSEVLTQKLPLPQEFVAVNDKFGETGTTMDLNRSRGLMEEDIINAANRVLRRKQTATNPKV